jgi:peptidoglycan/LPS O-acetylase OafA/YrhL
VRPLPALRRISYGVYLWHWPILLVKRRAQRPDRVSPFLARCVLTLAIATVSYTLVERPIRSGWWLRRPRPAVRLVAADARTWGPYRQASICAASRLPWVPA